MSARKLTALGYPVTTPFDPQDEKAFSNLVVWLEDRKIRQYEMNQRDKLRNTSSPEWNQAFETYLKDINCPLDVGGVSRAELADWMMGMAIRLDYNDNVDKYSKASAANVTATNGQAPQMVTDNPLDRLDFSSPEFIKGINEIADKLEISKHTNHLITLDAIVHYVKARMAREVVENAEDVVPKGRPFPIDEADMGFQTGDQVLNHASKILRLLHIHDVRELQTKINECIVAVQKITADPKTDTALGKVGY